MVKFPLNQIGTLWKLNKVNNDGEDDAYSAPVIFKARFEIKSDLNNISFGEFHGTGDIVYSDQDMFSIKDVVALGDHSTIINPNDLKDSFVIGQIDKTYNIAATQFLIKLHGGE